MRLPILFSILVTVSSAYESISYFKQSPDNQLLCHLGQHSFKMVSQKNSVIEDIHGHMYFKIKDENLYFLNNACQPLTKKTKPIDE